MAGKKLSQTIRDIPDYVRTHWNKANPGEFMPLKEVVAYGTTQVGVYIIGTVAGIMSFSATYFCGAIMGIAAMDFYMINIINTILSYALMFINPLGVLIYENHGRLTKKDKILAHICYSAQLIFGLICYTIPSESFEFIMKGFPQILGNCLVIGGISNYITWLIRRKFCAKYGRLKPFILICGIPAAIIMSIIPFLPLQNATYTLKLVILHFAFSLMGFFYNNYAGVNNMVTFMTPNSQERQRLYSIVPIVTGLTPSIINMIFPILIGVTGGYLDLTTYKVFVPIFSITGVLVSLAVAVCKERIIEPPLEKRKRVKFWQGAKNVIKNKYFWIINISNVFGQWQYVISNLLAWWFIYSLRMEWFSGIAANIVVVGMTLGNIVCPILTRRFEKRTILLLSRAATVLTILGVAVAVHYGNIYIFMIATFLRNTIAPVVDGVSAGLSADVLNYHQWKYGERADSMQGVFSWFLNPIIMGIGYILPALLKSVGFTSDWDVLYDSQILTNVFNIHTWVNVVGIILVTLPFIFYDLTREKHDQCVKELQERVRAIEEQGDPAQGVTSQVLAEEV